MGVISWVQEAGIGTKRHSGASKEPMLQRTGGEGGVVQKASV